MTAIQFQTTVETGTALEDARRHVNRTIQLFHNGIVALADVELAKAEFTRIKGE
jgi:hypothetical protein